MMQPGSLYLQPGEARRRTGSHYTPRSLTEPIVRTTLKPGLAALGPRPTPEQILSLKVCDPAMGSGAFLAEATRQLGEQLVLAWERHDRMPALSSTREPLLHARRLVAQHQIGKGAAGINTNGENGHADLRAPVTPAVLETLSERIRSPCPSRAGSMPSMSNTFQNEA